MRLRATLALWLIDRLDPDEVCGVARYAVSASDAVFLPGIARKAVAKLPADERRALWHDLGLSLNVAKDGHLDLGRGKEGN